MDRSVLLLFSSSSPHPLAVLKVPRLARLNQRTENEQRVLGEIRPELHKALRDSIPEALGSLRYGEVRASIESYLEGESMLRSSGRWGTSVARKLEEMRVAAGWLATFHARSELSREGWEESMIRRETEFHLSEYARRFSLTPVEERLFEALQTHSQRLFGTSCPLVWQHRDFNIQNLFRSGEHIAVIDWERTRPGPPLCDLLHFVTHWSEAVQRTPGDDGRRLNFQSLFCEPSGRNPITTAVHGAITQYMKQLRLEQGYLPLFLVYTWVELALRRNDRKREMGVALAHPRSDNPFFTYLDVLATHAHHLFPALAATFPRPQIPAPSD
jgi:aminoglycoside phosphotransferase (APT) family kinase protein